MNAMTQDAATPEARQLIGDYIRRVRDYVRAAGTCDAEEIVADVQSHIEHELEALSKPACASDVRDVLDRLGSPRQWIPENELPWWRRTLLRVKGGPNDWRLAYLVLALLVIGLLLGCIMGHVAGMAFGEMGASDVRQVDNRVQQYDDYDRLRPVGYKDRSHWWNYYTTGFVTVCGASFGAFFVLAFLVARAAVAGGSSLVPEQKWLVYPPLVVVYAAVLAAVFFGLAAAVGGSVFAFGENALRQHNTFHMQLQMGHRSEMPAIHWPLPLPPPQNDIQLAMLTGFFAIAAEGIVLTLVGFALLLGRFRGLVAVLFRPFFHDVNKRWAVAMLVIGLLFLLAPLALMA